MLRRFKLLLKLFVGFVVILAIALALYLYSGSTAVESWVGSQILQMAGRYLGPDLHFSRLTYIRPKSILLDGLTLTSPDPDHAGQTIEILKVKQARLELTEIPKKGQPIKFSEIILDSPQINLISGRSAGVALVGYSHFIKSSASGSAPQPAPAAPAAPRPATPTQPAAPGQRTTPAPSVASSAAASDTTSFKLSDALLIRHVQIINGAIRYDPRSANTPPLWLDAINTNLNFAPTDPSGSLYGINLAIDRKPAVNLSIQGQLDVDTWTLDAKNLALALDLKPDNIHILPSELQTLLTTYEVTGQLQLTASGTLPFMDWQKSSLQSTLALTSAQFAFSQYKIAVNSWTTQASLADGTATLAKSDADLFGGTLHAAGSIPLASKAPASLSLDLKNILIQNILRTTTPGKPPLYAGKLSTHLTFSAPLSAWNTQAAGSGTLTLREGDLSHTPVLGQIADLLKSALSKTLKGAPKILADSADAHFHFAGNAVQIDTFNATVGLMGLRAAGTIGFNQQLDLRLNAGPLESLQNALGDVGKILGAVTDNILTYRITGPISAPKLSLDLPRSP